MSCRSVFRDITADRFAQLHDEALGNTWFADSVVASDGTEPASTRWQSLSLPGTSVLELGPGTGHLLAAARQAGRRVAAVEPSEFHRAFISETWGIHSLYSDIASVPQGMVFDAVVANNVLEHIYDIADFLRSIRTVLAPGGVAFVSTVNAISAEAALLRAWWSMCKEHDHVSFPSPRGIARAALAAGLRPQRVWSAELPFELPVSTLVAGRDWARARARLDRGAAGGCQGTGLRPAGDAAARARMARFYAASGRYDPTSRVLAALGRAATVKARLQPCG